MSQGWEMMPWYGMIFGPIMMILVLATIIAVVVLIVRWLSGGLSPGSSQYISPQGRQNTALDILQERFARGEIEKEEFEERRRLLSE